MLGDDLDRLDGELFRAILGEHGNHNVANDVELCLIRGSDLNEHVGGVEGDLGVVAIDNGREGADDLVRIKDNGIDWLVADDVKITTKVLVGFVECHQLFSIHLLGLIQGDEVDVLGWQSFVGEGALDRIEIMRSDPTSLLAPNAQSMSGPRLCRRTRQVSVASPNSGGACLEDR